MENQKQPIKAEILIGRIYHGAWEAEEIYSDCFTLYINGQKVDSLKRFTSDYENNCKLTADEFLRILKKRGISNFEVINGKRLSSSLNSVVDCVEMPKSSLQFFEIKEDIEEMVKKSA